MTAAEPVRESAWDLAPGEEVVPHCVVRSRVGGGTTYEVYDTADDRLFAPVIVKVLRPHAVDDEAALGHLRREIRLLEALKHPLIPRAMHYDSEGPRPYVALEKAPGRTVEQITTSDGPLSPARTVDLGMGLAAVLHYLRLADVVHLDLLPRNVILDGRVPRLIDFDLARSSAAAATLRGPTGSPRCRAPEQCDPPTGGTATFATDSWGLGMTLYMSLTGRYPFARGVADENAPAAERFPQMVAEPSPLAVDAPAALGDVIAACLNKDPGQRPLPSEVYFALQSLSAGGTTSVTRASAAERAPQERATAPKEAYRAALDAKKRRPGHRPPR